MVADYDQFARQFKKLRERIMRIPEVAEITKVLIESQWTGLADPPGRSAELAIVRRADEFCSDTILPWRVDRQAGDRLPIPRHLPP